MKLSELKTDRACDVLCEIAPCIASIAGDDALMDGIGKVLNIDLEGISRYGLDLILIERMALVLPILLKDHRSDIYTILAGVNDLTIKEIAGQDFNTTKGQVEELLSDEAFAVFFKSFGRRGPNE